MKSLGYFFIFLTMTYPPMVYPGWKIVAKPVKLIGGEGEVYIRPVWSPDGSSIAFTAPGYRGLWVLRLESGNLRQISDETAAGFDFAWSSSGEAIVSRVAKFEGIRRYNAVKVFDIQRDKSWRLSEYRTKMLGLPRWTDADEKVYIFNGHELEMFDSGIKATALRRASAKKEMYYLKNGKIAISQIDSKITNVFDPLEGKRYINLVVSPDESKIAFEVVGSNFFVMKVDAVELTDLGIGYRPQWSPDGQYLVYMISKDDGHQITQSDIYTIKVDSSEKTKLTKTNDQLEMNPAWSPDGRKILFDTYLEGATYMIEVTK